MDTITRRELLRRAARAAIVGPLLLASREQQASLLLRLAGLFGRSSPVGRLLERLWIRW